MSSSLQARDEALDAAHEEVALERDLGSAAVAADDAGGDARSPAAPWASDGGGDAAEGGGDGAAAAAAARTPAATACDGVALLRSRLSEHEVRAATRRPRALARRLLLSGCDAQSAHVVSTGGRECGFDAHSSHAATCFALGRGTRVVPTPTPHTRRVLLHVLCSAARQARCERLRDLAGAAAAKACRDDLSHKDWLPRQLE